MVVSVVTFDTLELIEKLEKAGVPRDQSGVRNYKPAISVLICWHANKGSMAWVIGRPTTK